MSPKGPRRRQVIHNPVCWDFVSVAWLRLKQLACRAPRRDHQRLPGSSMPPPGGFGVHLLVDSVQLLTERICRSSFGRRTAVATFPVIGDAGTHMQQKVAEGDRSDHGASRGIRRDLQEDARGPGAGADVSRALALAADLPSARRSSNSSRVLGQSCRSKRERDRSASRRPPVWQPAQ